MEDYKEELIKLINYERDAEISVMVNEIKNMSASKRESLGRCITKMKGKRAGKELGLEIVQFGRSQRIDTEISVSDVVLVSTDYPLKSNVTGTVIEKGARYIKVAFDMKVPKWALKKKVRLDLYVNDVTFKMMEDNLKNLYLKGEYALGYHLKLNDPKISKKDAYIQYIDDSLNQSQQQAVVKSISTPNFYLIHGPFGTGKTRTLIELIQQEVRNHNKVLATAESNAAVDNMLERLIVNKKLNVTRLGHPLRVSEENVKYTLAYKVENHKKYNDIYMYNKKIEHLIQERSNYTKPVPKYRRGLNDSDIIHYAKKGTSSRGVNPKIIKSMAEWLKIDTQITKVNKKVKQLENNIISSIIEESDVILSTNSSAALESISNVKFDVAVIDEASQTTIPNILIPIAKAHRFILAGDHKQLPPTVLSNKAQKLSHTLFESLIDKYPHKSQLLNIQYRMNKKLMEFPNNEFYESHLKTDSEIENIKLGDLIDTNDDDIISFIDTSDMPNNQEKQLKDSKSIVNLCERDICIKLVEKYINQGINPKDIGIITPYSDQTNIISDMTDVEVKTVDGFQGREKEIIIISTVRSNDEDKMGFLSDLRRLNVAITRAKRRLIIVGNKQTLSSNPTYKRMIDSIKNNS